MPHVPSTHANPALHRATHFAGQSARPLAPPERSGNWFAWLVILLACAALAATPVQAAKPASASASASGQTQQSVNVNAADASQLSSGLKGVGGAKARAIVKYRQQHGDFKSLDDLLAVRGIGSKLLAANKDRIRFK